MATSIHPSTARLRLLVASLLGIFVGVTLSAMGRGQFAPLAAWDTAAFTYGCWTLLAILPMTAASTKAHAVSENPGRALADTLLLLASVASLVAIAILLIQASSSTAGEKVIYLSLGLASVVISWMVVHTTYALAYAREYYTEPAGGVDFGKFEANYADFVYLAFTIGMTFQVSDTALTTTRMRAIALRQALLSYLFGTVIIATTINTLAGLTK